MSTAGDTPPRTAAGDTAAQTAASETAARFSPHQIVLRPLVTEKGTRAAERDNCYAFEVNPMATKQEIRTAVEEMFHVRVLHVHTMVRKGKPRRVRFREGHTKDWKKAVVKLHPDYRIEFF
jgi:large subunit ribosomal protein L23